MEHMNPLEVIKKAFAGSRARAASRREAVASFVVMGLLAVVAATVLLKQSDFNPAVRESLKAAAGVSGSAVGKKGGDVLAQLPEGLSVMSPAERFNREALSDKINGRAELYLPAGLVGLTAQRIKFKSGSSVWLEIYIYDMGGPRGAFSVYSTQRRVGAPDVKFAKHGYRTANAISFIRGNDYIEIIASGTGPEITRTMLALGKKLGATGKAVAGGNELAEGDLFPKEGMIPGSVQLVAKNAFSFGEFNDIFIAQYRDGNSRISMFLSMRASPKEAVRLAAAYRKFLVRLGGEERSGNNPAGGWVVDMDGSFEGAFAMGRLLAGVHQIDDGVQAERWLARLHRAVKGKKL